MQNIIDKLGKLFPVKNVEKRFENQFYFETEKDHLIPLITQLRDLEGFKHLVLLTAVDWIEDGKFQLTYLLNNPEKKCDFGVKVMIDREEATMHSSHHLWPAIETYQRELFEMFGIDFPGSPRIDEPFVLEGWDGAPPYRRDFDTKRYSEETYFPRPGRSTKDPSEHMKEKLYPKK